MKFRLPSRLNRYLSLFFVLCMCMALIHPLLAQAVDMPSPIRMQEQNQVVYVSDYVQSVDQIISVTCTEGFACEIDADQRIIQVSADKEHTPYGNLRIAFGSEHVDILLMHTQPELVTFSYEDQNQKIDDVSLVGNMNDWNPTTTPLAWNDGQWSTQIPLKPGVYQYQFVVDGEWVLDPANETRVPNGIGGINSELRLPYPEIVQLNPKEANYGELLIETSQQINEVFAYINHERINAVIQDNNSISITLPEANSFPGRSHLRVWATDGTLQSTDVLIPLEDGQVVEDANKLNRFDRHQMIMYFLMVDRFENANALNDMPEEDPDIHPLANHLGGDIAGVAKKLNEGYFRELGVNTIWLSPIPQNPRGAFGLWDKGGVRSKFSAYHGYWPISFTKIDDRFGTSADLKALVQTAHEDENNVILDFVANHVHELHPVYVANKDKGWATDLYLPDGSLNTEKWDEQRLTTWFDVFLPTLNLERQEITEMLSDSAMYWLHEYNLDGFRHDATKHIPQKFWRTLTQKVKAFNAKRGLPIYQVGETYGSADLISSYIGSGMLDGQFDFNFYDASIASIINDDVGFDLLKDRIQESFSYYGYHHLMGNMTGNQDKPRFISLASGDILFNEDSKLAGWTRDIEKRTETSFDKLAMMQALIMTMPGIPCIYYGDEIGMPGGNDPDNRRTMKFENLTKEEAELRAIVSELTRLRSNHLALTFGSTEIKEATQHEFVFERTYLDERIIVLFNSSDKNMSYKIDVEAGEEIQSVFPQDDMFSMESPVLTVPPNKFKMVILKE